MDQNNFFNDGYRQLVSAANNSRQPSEHSQQQQQQHHHSQHLQHEHNPEERRRRRGHRNDQGHPAQTAQHSFLPSAGFESRQRTSRDDSSEIQRTNPQSAPQRDQGHNRELESYRQTADEFDQRIQRRRDQLLGQPEAYQEPPLEPRQIQERIRGETEQDQELEQLETQLHHEYALPQQQQQQQQQQKQQQQQQQQQQQPQQQPQQQHQQRRAAEYGSELTG